MTIAVRAGHARSRDATAAGVPAGAGSADPGRRGACVAYAEQLLRPRISTAPRPRGPPLIAGRPTQVLGLHPNVSTASC